VAWGVEQTGPFQRFVVVDAAAVAVGTLDERSRSGGLALRAPLRDDERADQQIERSAVFANRIAIEPGQAVAAVGDIACYRDLIGRAGLRTAGRDPLPGALQLADADTIDLGTLGRFLPPRRILDMNAGFRLERDAVSFLLPQPISGGRFPVVL
jgi:hypothetical protein